MHARARAHTHTHECLEEGLDGPRATLGPTFQVSSMQGFSLWAGGTREPPGDPGTHILSQGGRGRGHKAWQVTWCWSGWTFRGTAQARSDLVLHSPWGSKAPLLVSLLLHGGHGKSHTGQKSSRQGALGKVLGTEDRKRGRLQSSFRARERVLLAFSLKQGE